MAEVWEKQEFETPRQYAMFCAYRDLGTNRSLAKTVKALQKKPSYLRAMQKYSKDNRWVDRVTAYDLFCDEQNRRECEDEIKEMKRRHIREAEKMQEKALKRLEELNVREMGVSDCIKMLDVAVKIERMARDVDNNSKLEITNNVAICNINKELEEQKKLANLTIEELEEYENLIKKLNAPKEDVDYTIEDEEE